MFRSACRCRHSPSRPLPAFRAALVVLTFVRIGWRQIACAQQQQPQHEATLEKARQELEWELEQRWSQLTVTVGLAHERKKTILESLLAAARQARQLAANALECCSEHRDMQNHAKLLLSKRLLEQGGCLLCESPRE